MDDDSNIKPCRHLDKTCYWMLKNLHSALHQVHQVIVGCIVSTTPGERVAGCRGGSRYVKGCWGFPNLTSLLIYWFLGFGFLGFLVSSFQSSLVAWFQRLEDSIIPHYQIPISCFPKDIDAIPNICKILSDGSSGWFGAHLFQKKQNCACHKCRDLHKSFFRKWFGSFT